jgi:hypothetical protein
MLITTNVKRTGIVRDPSATGKTPFLRVIPSFRIGTITISCGKKASYLKPHPRRNNRNTQEKKARTLSHQTMNVLRNNSLVLHICFL